MRQPGRAKPVGGETEGDDDPSRSCVDAEEGPAGAPASMTVSSAEKEFNDAAKKLLADLERVRAQVIKGVGGESTELHNVQGDILHKMKGLGASLKHPMCPAFYLCVKYAFYEPDESMESLVRSALERRGVTADEIDNILIHDSGYTIPRIHRSVRPKKQMKAILEATFSIFGDVLDDKTGKPLLNAAAKAK